MAIPFSAIMPHNQQAILKKLDFPTFVNFKTCSHTSEAISSHVQTRLPLHLDFITCKRVAFKFKDHRNVHESPVQIQIECLIVNTDGDPSMCRMLSHFMRHICAKAMEVYVTKAACELGMYSATSLNMLSQASEAQELTLGSCDVSFELFFQPYIQKMKKIIFRNGIHLEDHDFTYLQAPFIILSQLPETEEIKRHLTLFFQQWMFGERKITKFRDQRNGSADRVPCFLKCVPYVSIWTPSTHKDTPISEVKLGRYCYDPSDEAFLFSNDLSIIMILFLDRTLWAAEVDSVDDAYSNMRKIFNEEVRIKQTPALRIGYLVGRFVSSLRRLFH